MSEMQIYPNEQPAAVAAPPEIMEEFALLMSLALDDALDAADALRFAALLDEHPDLAEVWDEWRTLDTELAHLPHLLPAAGFVERFEQRLAAEDARQQRWVIGLSVGATLVTMPVVLVSLVSTGTVALSTQGAWIGQQLHSLAFALLLVDRWLNTVVDTVLVMLGTPQARGVGLAYTAMALGMILIWVQLVRRSGGGPASSATPMMPSGE